MSDSKKPFKRDEKARVDLIEAVRRAFGISVMESSQAEPLAHCANPDPKRDDIEHGG